MAGSISSLGIGSGLDVNSIITSMMNVEKLPLGKLKSAATEMQTKLSAFGQIQSLVSAFRDATAPLYASSTFNSTLASSGDDTAVAASSTTAASPGSYSVSIRSLAAAQSVVSSAPPFANGSAIVGTGTLTLQLGSWSDSTPPAFKPKVGAVAIPPIEIGASENTLLGVRDKINAAKAGVTASVITDANGSRLSLQSGTAGAVNGFRLTVADADSTDSDAAGLSRLAYDPASSSAGMTLAQAAANSVATINGIEVSSASNTVTSVEGLTLMLNKVTAMPVPVTVSRNTDVIKTSLTSFVAAYNALASTLSAATRYDAENRSAALLQGDSTTTGIQSQLRAKLGEAGLASKTFGTLSSIGIEFQKDGSLKLNDGKLNKALENLPELTRALSNVDTADPSNNGFAKKLTSWADSLLSISGTLPGKARAIQAQLSSNDKAQARLNDRLADVEARLKKQYSALDTTLSSSNALNQYISQQITTWNKSER